MKNEYFIIDNFNSCFRQNCTSVTVKKKRKKSKPNDLDSALFIRSSDEIS